jgi:diaminohydroxyphosphoribosylaminopyrimidine deaminase/5-amino-6-(5-phosphoribosylamino)uracil reductase
VAASRFALAPGYGVGGVFGSLFGAADPARPAGVGSDDEYWMHRALLSAMAAPGWASPNPTVGAVIVKDGALLATGATQAYGQRHAERCAIDSVADRSLLCGATIYTTLEPCAHWGKQPPCADLVASCGFARCVVGVGDPNPDVAGAGLEWVRAAGTDVLAGVLRNEVLAWHLPYFFPHLVPADESRPLISVVPGGVSVREEGGPEGGDSSDGARRYRGWLKQKCDLVIAEPSWASVDPVAFAGGRCHGLVWWDLNGRVAGISVVQARDLAARARELGCPVTLVCARDTGNAEQLRALGGAGIELIDPSADVDPAAWLAASLQRGELAAVTDKRVAWVLIDEHPGLAGLLAAAEMVDVIHAPAAASTVPVGTQVGAAVAFSRITRNEVIGVAVSEYVTQRLSMALSQSPW